MARLCRISVLEAPRIGDLSSMLGMFALSTPARSNLPIRLAMKTQQYALNAPTLHIQTPLLESEALSRRCNARVRLKLDSLQPSGSFDLRGIGSSCQLQLLQGAKGLVSSCSANAAIAVAHSGRRLGVPTTIVVPERTSAHTRRLISREGAKVMVYGNSWQEATAHARSITRASEAFVDAVDDPIVWQGHATLIEEIALSSKPDALVIALGDGALLCGIIEGLQNVGWRQTPIIVAELEGVTTRIASSKASLPQPAVSVPNRNDPAIAATHPVSIVTVPRCDAAAASWRFLRDHRLLVDLECGAALDIVYSQNASLKGFRNIDVVVCGGPTATTIQLLDSLGGSGTLPHLQPRPDSHPAFA